MVESTAFFEAYRHVLEGLKEIHPAHLPMQNYIVKCEKEVEPPAYLRKVNQQQMQVTFDLTPIMKNKSYTAARRYCKRKLCLSWPKNVKCMVNLHTPSVSVKVCFLFPQI